MRSGNKGGSEEKGLRPLAGTIYTASRTRFPHLHVFLSSLVNIFASFSLCSFFCPLLSLSPLPSPLSISIDFVTLYRNSMLSSPPPPPTARAPLSGCFAQSVCRCRFNEPSNLATACTQKFVHKHLVYFVSWKQDHGAQMLDAADQL